MACLVDLKDFLDPSNDFMRGWVRGFVQVDYAILFQNLNGSISGRIAAGEGREVRRFHIELIEVLDTKYKFGAERCICYYKLSFLLGFFLGKISNPEKGGIFFNGAGISREDRRKEIKQ